MIINDHLLEGILGQLPKISAQLAAIQTKVG